MTHTHIRSFATLLGFLCFLCYSCSGGGGKKGDVDDVQNDTDSGDDVQNSRDVTIQPDIPSQNACSDMCPRVVAARCLAGPPALDDCIEGCNYMYLACPTEMQAAATCAGSRSFTCTVSGDPTVSGCESQFDDLMTCAE